MYRMPARFAANDCRAKRASSGPWDRSVGHTRKKYGLIPLRSGLEADGEITGTGLAPPPYTRAAAMGKRPGDADDDRTGFLGAGREPQRGAEQDWPFSQETSRYRVTRVGRSRGKVKLGSREAQRYPQCSTGSPPGFHLVFQTGVDD